MNKTRSLSCALALLMLAGSLIACSTGEISDETGDTNSQTQAAVSEGETVIRDNLPSDLNYGGDEITFISRYREGWSSGEISVPALISEPVNDAVYERNKAVEERLNIQIRNIEIDTVDHDEVPNKVKLAVQAGSRDYDIMAAPANGTIPTTLEGIFVDLRQTAYIDMEMPWWSQGFNEVAEYGDAQYAVTGSIVLSLYRFAFVTVFNQKLFNDAGQTFLYDYVENGTWTLDQQISLVPLFHKDNGNGEQDPEGDVYGFVTGNLISVDPYWSACDVAILGRDEDGEYVMEFDVAKLQDVMDKVLTLYYGTDDSAYVFATYASDSEQADIRDTFAAGYGAMATLRILELENAAMRNMADKYGVVPMPKFDEVQKDYHTFLHNQFTLLSIPTTVQTARLDEISAVLEALAAESYRVVRPAYYETTLRTKLAQDPQSSEMMEIIVNNIYIDAGVLYSRELDSFYSHPRSVIQSKQNDVISHYAGIDKKCQKYLRILANKLNRIAG